MIALTGAFGFVGRALKATLGDAEVVTLGRPLEGSSEQHIPFDLTETDAAPALVKALRPFRPTCLIHLAGTTPWSKVPDFFLDIKMAATVARVCNELAVRRLLFMSGWVVYDSAEPVPYAEPARLAPNTPYGASKMATERYLAEHLRGTDLINVRAASIYGPGQRSGGLIPNLVGQGLRGEPIRLNARLTKRDYIFIGDAVRAVRQLALIEVVEQVAAMNLGGGRSVSVAEVAETIQVVFREDHDRDVSIGYADPLTEGEPRDNQLSIAKARGLGLLGSQTPFKEGIRAYVAWRKSEGLL